MGYFGSEVCWWFLLRIRRKNGKLSLKHHQFGRNMFFFPTTLRANLRNYEVDDSPTNGADILTWVSPRKGAIRSIKNPFIRGSNLQQVCRFQSAHLRIQEVFRIKMFQSCVWLFVFVFCFAGLNIQKPSRGCIVWESFIVIKRAHRTGHRWCKCIYIYL